MLIRRLSFCFLIVTFLFFALVFVERVRRFYVESSYLQCEFGTNCGWIKRSETAIALNGNITAAGNGSYAAFSKVFTNSVKTIYLNSGGGSVEEAIKIANVIKVSGADTVVTGACLSACSNYIFISGRKKRISGVLGFHGGAVSIYRHGPRSPGFNVDYAAALAKEEEIFFNSLNVDRAFIDISYRKDRGFVGHRYDFYAPDRNILERFGVKNVTGGQDQIVLGYLRIFDYQKGGVPQFGEGNNVVVNTYLRSRDSKHVSDAVDENVEYGF